MREVRRERWRERERGGERERGREGGRAWEMQMCRGVFALI